MAIDDESDRSHAGLLAWGSDRTIFVGSKFTAMGFGGQVETFDGEASGIVALELPGLRRRVGARSGRP